MASIVKRNNRYCVVYNYTDENGKRKQKWETYKTMVQAKTRQKEIEYHQSQDTFVIPECHTLGELLKEYIDLYGKEVWALSTYTHNISLINNYILPCIGDVRLSELTARVLEKYYQQLLKMTVVPNRKSSKSTPKAITASTINDIHNILRNCLKQAVKWELIEKNPAVNATVPKYKSKKRDIWTSDTLFDAISRCKDTSLRISMNLAFSCSLRMGEMLGLTWDCVDISQEALEKGESFVLINKELQRVSRIALEKLDSKDVILIFPSESSTTSTVQVLKTPKTQSSVRKVFLPPTVANMLIEWKKEQDQTKEILGDEYKDFNLILAGPNGMPIEGSRIRYLFNSLIQEEGLPKVVFHSLRHSSVTYKLKLTGGNVKAVQGDSGHAQSSMVTDLYSHILDDDRKKNAQLFEEAFYSGKGKREDTKSPTMVRGENEDADRVSSDDNMQLILKLLSNPDTAELLKSLAKAIKD